jgi:CheY-like chemotaxis protein
MDKLKVLVIHDEDKIRKGIHSILSNFNLEFIFAKDGLDGIIAAKYDCPDLIISKVKLDILDGLTMGRMLKEDCTTSDTPIIYLHDYLDYQFLTQARFNEAKAFLLKPYLDNSLIYAVKRSLSKPLERLESPINSYEKSMKSRTPIFQLSH